MANAQAGLDRDGEGKAKRNVQRLANVAAVYGKTASVRETADRLGLSCREVADDLRHLRGDHAPDSPPQA